MLITQNVWNGYIPLNVIYTSVSLFKDRDTFKKYLELNKRKSYDPICTATHASYFISMSYVD